MNGTETQRDRQRVSSPVSTGQAHLNPQQTNRMAINQPLLISSFYLLLCLSIIVVALISAVVDNQSVGRVIIVNSRHLHRKTTTTYSNADIDTS